MALNNKQRAFIEHYLRCWNATEAAKRAGYSEKTAYSIGHENLKKLEIQTVITTRTAELKATTDEVLLRLASHSRGSMDDFIGGFDRIDLARARDRGVMHLVKKIKQRTTTFSKSDGEDVEIHDVELELYDAQAATVQLAKILGLYIERIEVSDLRDKADDELISEFQSIVNAARTRAGASDNG